MLIEGAIKFARAGREGLEQKDYEKSYNGLSQCQAILIELVNSLKPEVDSDLCSRLSGLYTFMYRRLMDATLERNPEIVDEVIGLLEYDRETWIMLMQRLSEERTAETRNGDESPMTAGNLEDSRPSLSVQG